MIYSETCNTKKKKRPAPHAQNEQCGVGQDTKISVPGAIMHLDTERLHCSSPVPFVAGAIRHWTRSLLGPFVAGLGVLACWVRRCCAGLVAGVLGPFVAGVLGPLVAGAPGSLLAPFVARPACCWRAGMGLFVAGPVCCWCRSSLPLLVAGAVRCRLALFIAGGVGCWGIRHWVCSCCHISAGVRAGVRAGVFVPLVYRVLCCCVTTRIILQYTADVRSDSARWPRRSISKTDMGITVFLHLDRPTSFRFY
jgi:hypothetical protein